VKREWEERWNGEVRCWSGAEITVIPPGPPQSLVLRSAQGKRQAEGGGRQRDRAGA